MSTKTHSAPPQNRVTYSVRPSRTVRLRDALAGFRDRKTIRATFHDDSDIVDNTTYLNMIGANYEAAAEQAHRTACALEAPLRIRARSLCAKHQTVSATLPGLEAKVAEVADLPVTDTPRSAAEATEPADVLRRRRGREHQAQVSAAKARANAAAAELRAIEVELAELHEQFLSIELDCAIQVAEAHAMNQSRASAYVRWGTRGLAYQGRAAKAPLLDQPVWQPETFPMLPTTNPDAGNDWEFAA